MTDSFTDRELRLAREADRRLTEKGRPVPLLPPARNIGFCQSKIDLGGNCYQCMHGGKYCYCEREALRDEAYFVVAMGRWIEISPADSLLAAQQYVGRMYPAEYRKAALIVWTKYPPKHRKNTVPESAFWAYVRHVPVVGGIWDKDL